MSLALVRPYRPEDRDAVRHVCYETGLLGDNVREHYRDFASYADIFTSYYTDREPEHALVVEQDGRVVGYILGCLDSRRAWSPFRLAFKHAVLRGVCFRPGTAGYYWRGALDVFADLGKPARPNIDLARYPSHLHINLLPEARGSGVGRELVFRLHDLLKREGSTGIYAEASAHNARFLAIATEKLGYEFVGEPYLAPGGRMPDGRRIWLRMIRRDLTRWVPSAWQQTHHAPLRV